MHEVVYTDAATRPTLQHCLGQSYKWTFAIGCTFRSRNQCHELVSFVTSEEDRGECSRVRAYFDSRVGQGLG